jgi:ATP-dependent RNA helicase DDX1
MAAAFAELGLMPELIQAIDDMGWVFPTPVQSEAIPLILGGGDVCVAAPTGSGKTGAFCLPTLQIVHETLNYTSAADQSRSGASSNPDRWKMSALDRAPHLILDASGLLCASTELHQWSGGRAAFGMLPSARGKWYYEVQVLGDGLCRVGWSAACSTLALGEDDLSYGFGGTAKKSHCGKFESYGGAFGKNDVVGVALDWENGEIWFSKNGEPLGRAFSINRKTLGDRALYPHVYLKNSQVRVIFSDTSYLPGAGFREVGSAGPQERTTPEREGAVDLQGTHRPSNAPLMLILEPTRELALQVHQELHRFSRFLDEDQTSSSEKVQCVLFTGGSASQNEALGAPQSRIDIATCTPGRLFDAIRTKQLDVRAVRFLALDEVDGLLTMGCGSQIMQLLGMIPRQGRRHRLQIIMFSATVNAPRVRQLSDRIQEHATWVDVRGPETVPSTVDHLVVRIDPGTALQLVQEEEGIAPAPAASLPATDAVHVGVDYRDAETASLSQRIKLAKPILCLRLLEVFQMDQVMIFCRTQLDCDLLQQFLEQHAAIRGATATLHAGLADQQRRQHFTAFKEGQVRILICTDVAARGIDISGLPFLISMTLPDEVENYLHRIGRVGRADRLGLAISLVSTVPERVWFHSSCRKRAKGKCQNRALTTEGGCTIWYDESEILRRLEAQLGEANMPEILDVNQVLQAKDPAALQAYVRGLAQYGRKRGEIGAACVNTVDPELEQRLHHTQQVARRVQELEKNVQWRFLRRLQNAR